MSDTCHGCKEIMDQCEHLDYCDFCKVEVHPWCKEDMHFVCEYEICISCEIHCESYNKFGCRWGRAAPITPAIRVIFIFSL